MACIEAQWASDILDDAVLASGYACVLAHPHHALHSTFMRERGARFRKEVWLCIRPTEIEHPHFLLLAAGEQVRSVGGYRDAADNVIMGKGMECFAAVRVPDLPEDRILRVEKRSTSASQKHVNGTMRDAVTYAVKSALPEAAREVSGDSLLHQTAPL